MDYSKYGDNELWKCFKNADKEKDPESFNAIVAEVQKRGLPKVPSEKQKGIQSPGANSSLLTVEVQDERYPPERILDLIENQGKKSFNPFYLFFLSVLFFVLAGILAFDRKFLLLIIPTIFIHELGHLMAMKIFKYKNTKILFVPLLGGLASGIPQQQNRIKESIVALAGPVVGIAAGMVFVFLYGFTKSRVWVELAYYSMIINLLNLLPIPPLDGGRLMESLVTSRNFFLEISYKILGASVLIMGAIHFKDKFLGLLGYFTLIFIWTSIREQKAVRLIQKSGNAMGDVLTVENVSVLISATLATYKGFRPLKPKHMATYVKRLFEKLHRKNAPWLPTIALSVLYAVILVFALVNTASVIHLKRQLLHSSP